MLNESEKLKTEELSNSLSDVIVTSLVNNKEEITFDYVYCKIYDIFSDSLLSEQVFDKVQTKLEKDHNIVLEQKDIDI